MLGQQGRVWVGGCAKLSNLPFPNMESSALLHRERALETALGVLDSVTWILCTQHSDKAVQDRGLVVTDLKAKDIILEHKSYCAKKTKERNFLGDVLGYITPWNSHGYDIAKIFGNKFRIISPVWLQVKRRGKEKFQFTGLHDADQGWMKEVKKNAKSIKIVPRVLFEGWTYQDFESVFGSEDEIEELSGTMVQVAENENFDGFVVEVWSQLGNQKHTFRLQGPVSFLERVVLMASIAA
uniref:Chitinase domain-containing protein 1 n=1 Tax=Sphaerodactylus townsendi TaxID=933632 RepID=A0ACB8G392_9SAUR